MRGTLASHVVLRRDCCVWRSLNRELSWLRSENGKVSEGVRGEIWLWGRYQVHGSGGNNV